MRPNLLAATLVTLCWACVHEISSEERLERETNNVAVGKTAGAAELKKISCADTDTELIKARDVNRNETDRVMGYTEVFDSLKKKTTTFEDAMTRNPDLMYQEGSQEFVGAKDVCVKQTADVRLEFEQYVRDLVDVPTVQEIKGGNTVVVARLDFVTLRKAIEALAPDDKEALLNRIANAEKKLQAAEETKRKK